MKEIQDKILKFRDDRNWEQFHTIKDLLIGLNIEVGELQEIFLWKTDNEVSSIDENQKVLIADELSDIFIFLTYISKRFNIDLSEAVNMKVEKNNLKYPVDKSINNKKKYNEL